MDAFEHYKRLHELASNVVESYAVAIAPLENPAIVAKAKARLDELIDELDLELNRIESLAPDADPNGESKISSGE
jgi:hypothetical protein